MKILAYVHAYRGMSHNAGGETSMHDLLRGLQASGHDCRVLVAEPTHIPPYHLDGVSVQTIPDTATAKAAPFGDIAWADIVFTQLTSSYRAGLIARSMGKPVVHYAHNDHKYTARMVAQQSDVLLANSDWVLKSLRSQGAWTPGQILHPPVDPACYRTRRTRAARHVTLINLSTGSDGHYDKGYQTFLSLAERHPAIPFLAVAGAYGEQARSPLPNVEFVAHTEDIRDVYKRTKVLLVPSRYESFGRVAVEAAASGIPAICTPTTGLREAMRQGALYADYGDVDAWDRQLAAVLDSYSERSQYALERSESLWRQTEQEVAGVHLMLEIIESGGLREYYDYITSR